jgi:Cyclic nucleotide-binding domain
MRQQFRVQFGSLYSKLKLETDTSWRLAMSSVPLNAVVPTTGGGAAAAPAREFDEGPKSDSAHFLQRIKLFSTLSVEECQQVVKRMKRRDFLPNQVIVREGAPGSSMFFVTAGLVDVRKKDPHTGIEFLLTEMGPGQNFGEMALLTGKPRTASVTAMQPTTCAVLEHVDFQELLLSYPKIGLP